MFNLKLAPQQMLTFERIRESTTQTRPIVYCKQFAGKRTSTSINNRKCTNAEKQRNEHKKMDSDEEYDVFL